MAIIEFSVLKLRGIITPQRVGLPYLPTTLPLWGYLKLCRWSLRACMRILEYMSVSVCTCLCILYLSHPSSVTITPKRKTTMKNENTPKNSQQPLFQPVTSPLQAIMIIEDGCTSATPTQAFQYLIDTGIVWTLQGWYGRTAKALIEQGICTR